MAEMCLNTPSFLKYKHMENNLRNIFSVELLECCDDKLIIACRGFTSNLTKHDGHFVMIIFLVDISS